MPIPKNSKKRAVENNLLEQYSIFYKILWLQCRSSTKYAQYLLDYIGLCKKSGKYIGHPFLGLTSKDFFVDKWINSDYYGGMKAAYDSMESILQELVNQWDRKYEKKKPL